MSWLQRLLGKLKSVFGGKGAQRKTATEAATPPRAKTSAEPAEKAPEPAAVLTEDKPADEPEETAKEADKPAPEETAVAESKPATEAPAPADEPTADSATEPTAEPAVPPADSTAEPTAESTTEPVASAEPVAEAEPVEPAAAPADEPVTSAAIEEPAASASAEQVAEVEPKPVERVNPAINTLDDDSRTAELIAEGPYGPGSGKPTADGSAPSSDFTVKAKQSSKLFHTEKSPYFSRTKADVWFKTEADAEAAGFQAWDHKKRTAAKK